jgi:hypothetical protein
MAEDVVSGVGRRMKHRAIGRYHSFRRGGGDTTPMTPARVGGRGVGGGRRCHEVSVIVEYGRARIICSMTSMRPSPQTGHVRKEIPVRTS